jgi:hypothetical protein
MYDAKTGGRDRVVLAPVIYDATATARTAPDEQD